MTELVHYAATDGVGTITLDSPHNRNALSRQLISELFERFEEAAADDDVRVVVLRSADRVFCSGADLSEAGRVDDRGRRSTGRAAARDTVLPEADHHPAG